MNVNIIKKYFILLFAATAIFSACGGNSGGSDSKSGTASNPSAKEITAFSILGNSGSIVGNSIGVTVPYGTTVTSLVATFTTTGQSVKIGSAVQDSGTTVNNFTTSQIYRVTAVDGSIQDYTVTVTVALNNAKDITAFSLDGQTGTISGTDIAVTMPYGTDRSSLRATFSHTGQSVKIGSDEQTSESTPNDFTNPVTYVVTAADSSTKSYTVTVSVALNSAKDITAFSLAGVSGTISGTDIAVTVPYGTSLNGLAATFTKTGDSVKVGSTVQTSGSTPNDFTNPVTYVVTAADGTTKSYIVTVTVGQGTVTYNGNGATGGSVPVDSNGYSAVSTVTVLGNTGSLLKINVSGVSYKFVGWTINSDGTGTVYTEASTFTFGSVNLVLYAKWSPYVLRDTGPAGGLIFYDKGSYSNGWRYMEAAPADQSSSQAWSNVTSLLGSTSVSIGTGSTNTSAIIAQSGHTTSGAKICSDRSVTAGGVIYDDWFLPSKDELNKIYINLQSGTDENAVTYTAVGNFSATSGYWSSSENSSTLGYYQYFGNGVMATSNKGAGLRVRAVRVF